MLWNDIPNPLSGDSPRVVLCSIDPVYHRASNGKYYKINFVPNGGYVTAGDAQQMCERRGGNLAMTYKPTDFKAMPHIHQILSTDTCSRQAVWVAGTDEVTEGKWVMPDGNDDKVFIFRPCISGQTLLTIIYFLIIEKIFV
jgi:hypothetical protein